MNKLDDQATLFDAAEVLEEVEKQPRRWKVHARFKRARLVSIDTLPAHWTTEPLKHVARINPSDLPENTDPDYVLRYVDISNTDHILGITGSEDLRFENAPSRARRVVQHGDTIISTVRTYLRAIAWIDTPPDNLVVSTGFAVLRPSKKLDPEFLYRLVQAEEFVGPVVAHSVGVSYPAIAPTHLGRFHIPLPPLSEQRAIAGFLRRETAKIDALVDKKRRLIDLLKEKRAALISHAVTKGLNPNAPMKPSGVEWLGDVPEHWAVVPIAAVSASIQTGPFGSQLHQADYVTNGTPVINPVHLVDSRIAPDLDCAVDQLTAVRLSRHQLLSGDILFARRGEIGRCGLATTECIGWLCGTGCMRLRLSRGSAEFFSYVFNSKGFADTLTVNAVGTTMLNINNAILGRMDVAFPPVSEQEAIVAFLERDLRRHSSLLAGISDAIARLTEYRSALISAAVTGKIDVRDEVGGADV